VQRLCVLDGPVTGVAIGSIVTDTVTIRLRTMKKLVVQINTLDAQWTGRQLFGCACMRTMKELTVQINAPDVRQTVW
jgi:hypothetical protein